MGVRSLQDSGPGTVYLALNPVLVCMCVCVCKDHYPCFTEEETEVQRGPEACSMSREQSWGMNQSLQTPAPGLFPRALGPGEGQSGSSAGLGPSSVFL